MWRNTERASLEKKPWKVEPRPMGRREGESEASDRLRGKPGCGLARDMGGMFVEDDLDRGIGRVGRVEELKKLNEFAAAVAFRDRAWRCPVNRSIPAIRVRVPCRYP
jgi:hypothetical protein